MGWLLCLALLATRFTERRKNRTAHGQRAQHNAQRPAHCNMDSSRDGPRTNSRADLSDRKRASRLMALC